MQSLGVEPGLQDSVAVALAATRTASRSLTLEGLRAALRVAGVAARTALRIQEALVRNSVRCTGATAVLRFASDVG